MSVARFRFLDMNLRILSPCRRFATRIHAPSEGEALAYSPLGLRRLGGWRHSIRGGSKAHSWASTTMLRDPTSTVAKPFVKRYVGIVVRVDQQLLRVLQRVGRTTVTEATDEDGGPSGTGDAIAPRTATVILRSGLPPSFHASRPRTSGKSGI